MVNQFKIGIMPMRSYNNMSIESICKDIKSIGYDAVEWHRDIFCPRKKTYEQLKEIIKITQDNGLEISEIVVQKDLVLKEDEERKDNIEYIKECIQVFSSLGISTINLFTGPVPWGKHPLVIGRDIKEGEAWDLVLDAFESLVKLSEQCKMNLAVENVWGMLCHDFYTAKYLIDYFNTPYLGVNFDPSHDILAGNLDVGWIIKQWGKDRIKHIHLKDAVGVQTAGKFIFPLLGEGLVDWKGFIKALKEINYDGVMSVEFESFNYLERVLDNDMSKAARLSFNNIVKLFNENY